MAEKQLYSSFLTPMLRVININTWRPIDKGPMLQGSHFSLKRKGYGKEESRAFGNKMEEGEALIMAPHIPESERSAWRPQQMTAAAFPSLMRMLLVVETVSGEDSQKGGMGRYGMEMSRGT
ncbi:hypothetical protein KUCAC02_018907 [Chaenocephalus aceratus]|uniref:Uncharacterized protein n=1 Tax=Chaenocephalus aceratus TaxID=36190 RepID=A0ACB9W9Z4_CHAAC|nr:hypothetical protein KUCAC02_018907 [Chaenocephalus aceratus]